MIPEHEYLEAYGIKFVTQELFEKYHTQEEITRFGEWFCGQTGIVAKDGTLGIYADDYERWASQGMGTEQRSADWD